MRLIMEKIKTTKSDVTSDLALRAVWRGRMSKSTRAASLSVTEWGSASSSHVIRNTAIPALQLAAFWRDKHSASTEMELYYCLQYTQDFRVNPCMVPAAVLPQPPPEHHLYRGYKCKYPKNTNRKPKKLRQMDCWLGHLSQVHKLRCYITSHNITHTESCTHPSIAKIAFPNWKYAPKENVWDSWAAQCNFR